MTSASISRNTPSQSAWVDAVLQGDTTKGFDDWKAENTLDEVTLKMTSDQARTLSLILNRIGGDPRNSLRKNVDPVNRKLHSLGLDIPDAWNSPRFFKQETATRRPGLYFVSGQDF